MSDKILKLSQAQTLYQDLRGRIDALPTDSDIPEVPVMDVQINGTSVLSQGVANVPIADGSTLGVVKKDGTGFSIDINSSGAIQVVGADSATIKSANTNNKRPILPAKQHEAVFYGLAKAAGDSTQSASSNAVGTYTDTAKQKIQNMLGITSLFSTEESSTAIAAHAANFLFMMDGKLNRATTAIAVGDAVEIGTNCVQTTIADELSSTNSALLQKVEKSELDNAGITDKTYTTIVDETVTTVDDGVHASPYVQLSGGSFDGRYKYRITLNDNVYEVGLASWYEIINSSVKGFEFIGDITLYLTTFNTSLLCYDHFDLPFLIIYNNLVYNGLQLLTPTAGTYSIKIEQINYTKENIPKSLIWGNEYDPIHHWLHNGSSYQKVSVGINALGARGTYAVGDFNTCSSEFSYALGYKNTASGVNSVAIGAQSSAEAVCATALGYGVHALGNYSHAEGSESVSSGWVAHAEGLSTTASGNYSHSEGRETVASGSYSHAQNRQTTANGVFMTAMGRKNVQAVQFSDWVANTSYAVGDCIKNGTTGYVCTTANSDATFNSTNWKQLPTYFDTAFAIGNGSSSNSNALKVDWLGNGRFAGNVYVGCNADSTGGTMLPHDVQVNGTSVVSNGVANIPVAGVSDTGAVRVDSYYGIGITPSTSTSPYTIRVVKASDAQVKAGTANYYPIVPSNQGASTFYGLATASGDTSQSSSSNAVGVYTDNAKTAIKSMLGVSDQVVPVFSYDGNGYTCNMTYSQVYSAVQNKQCTSALAGGVYLFLDSANNNGVWFKSFDKSSAEYVRIDYYSIRNDDSVDVLGIETDERDSIANYEYSDTSSHAYSVGDLFMYCEYNDSTTASSTESYCTSSLRRAIANIAVGDAITHNNCERTTIADEFSSVNSALNSKQDTPASGATAGKVLGLTEVSNELVPTWVAQPTVPVTDVQVNGTSVVSNGVVDIPIGSSSNLGVVKSESGYGIFINSTSGRLYTDKAASSHIKAGTDQFRPIVPYNQHEAVFYGLATAAGDSSQASSDNAVGTYTSGAKTAIQTMLGAQAAIEVIRL